MEAARFIACAAATLAAVLTAWAAWALPFMPLVIVAVLLELIALLVLSYEGELMDVRIIKATENPVDVIAFAAGICYGKRDTDPRRVRACFKAEHLSVFEHASVTFMAEGISRACLAQLTRHRLASYCVESQRYNRYDLAGEYWYVIPEGAEDKLTWFRKCMRDAASAYQQALNMGIKPEDARYLLPEAAKRTSQTR